MSVFSLFKSWITAAPPASTRRIIHASLIKLCVPVGAFPSREDQTSISLRIVHGVKLIKTTAAIKQQIALQLTICIAMMPLQIIAKLSIPQVAEVAGKIRITIERTLANRLIVKKSAFRISICRTWWASRFTGITQFREFSRSTSPLMRRNETGITLAIIFNRLSRGILYAGGASVVFPRSGSTSEGRLFIKLLFLIFTTANAWMSWAAGTFDKIPFIAGVNARTLCAINSQTSAGRWVCQVVVPALASIIFTTEMVHVPIANVVTVANCPVEPTVFYALPLRILIIAG